MHASLRSARLVRCSLLSSACHYTSRFCGSLAHTGQLDYSSKLPNPLPSSLRRRPSPMSLQTPASLRRSLSNGPVSSTSNGALAHKAFIALGSNLGDRVDWIEKACNEIESQDDIRILHTSGLWETKAMYVEDQNHFVNGACEIETSLSPMQLLARLQNIENKLGRVKVIDKGPRNIDLDILLYDSEVVENEKLIIPHKLMLEREFVLRPLCELIPEATLPTVLGTLKQHLSQLKPSEPPLSTMTPLSPTLSPISALQPTRRTHVMSILNLTPDSFSDGGRNVPSNLDPASSEALNHLKQTILSHITAGATILDIGGQSTRPGAPQVSAQEELDRILPALHLLRNLPEAAHVAISIDTYRASVAEAAIEAGAHIINDVSAGLLDAALLPTVAKLGCTVCLMHMRGTPDTMQQLTTYPTGVLEGVREELSERVRAAEAAGIRRWRIILDPGLGFAKTQAQNVELLRRLAELRACPEFAGMPWLVGSSRKGFVGKITGVAEPRDRVMGTGVTVAAAVLGGADVVRVHDVKPMVEAVKMADAIWRG